MIGLPRNNTSMKNSFRNYSMFAEMAMLESGMPIMESEESIEEKKYRIQKAEFKINESRGLKQFIYNYLGHDFIVWALNKKNADKKAKKNGWI